MIERKKYGITPLSASGKEKYISGAADFGAAAGHGHGFHTQPLIGFIFLICGCFHGNFFLISRVADEGVLKFSSHELRKPGRNFSVACVSMYIYHCLNVLKDIEQNSRISLVFVDEKDAWALVW